MLVNKYPLTQRQKRAAEFLVQTNSTSGLQACAVQLQKLTQGHTVCGTSCSVNAVNICSAAKVAIRHLSNINPPQ